MSEGTCPFCGVAFEASFGAAPAPTGPSARLSRAALFAFSAGTAILAPALAIDCTTSVEPLYGGSGIAPYGSEPFPDSGEIWPDGSNGRVPPDVSVGNPDAGDGSVGSADASDGSVGNADAGDSSGDSADASDGSIDAAGSDGGADGAVDDAESDGGDAS